MVSWESFSDQSSDRKEQWVILSAAAQSLSGHCCCASLPISVTSPCCARSSPREPQPLLGLGLWRPQEAFYQEPGSFPHRLKSQSFWRQQQRRYEVLSWIIHDETIIRPQFENGPKASLLFSDQEYEGRLTKLRSYQILVY